MAIGKKTGGRKKGTPNKLSHDVRDTILQVAEKIGGGTRLVKWIDEDPINERLFWSQMYVKLLPKEIKADLTLNGDLAKRLAKAREILNGKS